MKNFAKGFLIMFLNITMNQCTHFNKTPLDSAYQFENKNHMQKDKRTFKVVTLANQLEVLLISSEDYNKSAAALDVAVGSLQDPEEIQGLSHFLEHMLFLGTEKYPDVGEYNEYLAAHQGMSNAYTSRENTNYYFEVNQEGFEGALDRFSQFFIRPLFDIQYVERELNAVNSEHQKNLNSDLWRNIRVLYDSSSASHPRRKFSTGNSDTLRKVDEKILREYFNKYYSANKMKLVLMSTDSIETMEKLVLQKFSDIKNNNRESLQYSHILYDKEKLPRMIQIKPIKDLRELELVFSAPSNVPFSRSKPTHIISHILGHEGKGSLLSWLKERHYATTLSAWFDSYTFAGEFHFKIALTEKGLKEKNQVLRGFFAYIKMLQQQKTLPMYLYKELKSMAEINYIFREHTEGGSVASSFASFMHIHPALEIEQQTILFYEYDHKAYTNFLSYITPENMNVLLTADNVATDTVEPYYGVKYSINPLDQELSKSLKSVTLEKQMSLPEANNYIPNKFSLRSTQNANNPIQIINDDDNIFWFQEDSLFETPKAKVSLLLKTKLVNSTALNKVKTTLYQYSLKESLNEWKYNVSLAGLDFQIYPEDKGIMLTVEGFSQHIPKLISELSHKLKEINIDEKTFAIIKNDFKRSIRNIEHNKAYQKALYEMQDLLNPLSIHYKQYFDQSNQVDLISSVSLDDIKKFSNQLFSVFAIEGIAYGNLDEKQIRAAILGYPKALQAKTLPKKEQPLDTTYKLTPGKSKGYVLKTKEEHPNNCWGSYIQFGARNFALNAIIRMGQAILTPDFYNELRTEQQLGYIVHSGLRFHEKTLGMLFLVQSSEYDPYEIELRYQAWVPLVLKKLESMSNFEFDTYKNGVINQLKEQDKTINERHSTLYFEAITMNEQFNYKEKVIEAAKKLTKDQVSAAFKYALNQAKKASLNIYVLSKKSTGNTPSVSNIEFIQDKAQYKKTAKVY